MPQIIVVKANPTVSDVHRSTPLTNISIGWAQANQGKYKGSRIFPRVGVQKKSDRFYEYTRADLLRSQAQRRAAGAPAEKGGYRISDSPYECERWALGRNVSDPERGNADPQFDLDAEATEFVTDQIMMAEEIEFTGGFFTTGIWTGGSGGATDQSGVAGVPVANQFLQWNDAASTPIEDIRQQLTTVESNTGYRPNKGVLGAHVWNDLADHPDLLDRIKHTQTGIVAPQLLASILELDEIIVLNAVRNSALEGAAENADYIAGRHGLFLYVTPRPGLRVPTAGYTFVWTGNGTPLNGVSIKRYRDEPLESDVIEGEGWSDPARVAADLGVFFSGAVAT